MEVWIWMLKQVALKVINTDDIEDEYVSRNLHREANILRDLDHPNIIHLYETVRTVNLYCLSLELIRGINLYQYMQKQPDKRISEKLARIFFYQMLSAVRYMHHLHIIHRDLKQENILVESGHIIKIVDFGLSNIYYPCHRPRTHCGSVEYAAPELFKSHSVYGTAADLWSLGVILYAMVVGEMPFQFNREVTDVIESKIKRDRFVQRISKGLLQENWELMEDLTPDCWNLLHDLLQPDQFRRIRIEDAITHHWITKDAHLKKRLPQRRRDLQRRFHSEIVGYLAQKLNVSVARVENHINAANQDRVQCMYYIIRDTLMKDVLYPPKDIESTFLYQFDCWRRTHIFGADENSDYSEYEQVKLESNKFTTEKSSLSTGIRKEKSPSKDLSQTNNPVIDSVIKMLEKSTLKETKYSTRSVKSTNLVNNDKDVKEDQQTVSVHRYRSYKSSRPERGKSLLIMQNDDTNRIPHNSGASRSSERKNQTPSIAKLRCKSSATDERKSEDTPKEILVPESKIPRLQIKDRSFEKPDVVANTSTKCTKATDKKQGLAETHTRSVYSTYRSAREYKNSELRKKKMITTPQKATRNTNPSEVTPKPTGQTGVILLRRKQNSADVPDKHEEVKKAITSEIPSTIHTKNMRHGPAALCSPANDFCKTKESKRATVADRISLCRGDTNERLQ